MGEIFVNLKRFDVPRSWGGICPMDNPQEWIEYVINESVKAGLGNLEKLNVTYLLPEGLIPGAVNKLKSHPDNLIRTLRIGCQGVYREDVAPGANFGAFTTNLPAAAARNLGCTWAIIGHSEERKDKLGIIERFEPALSDNDELRARANKTVNAIINEEVLCALDRGIDVLLCVGETAAERGEGDFQEQKPRIESVLQSQLEIGLKKAHEKYADRDIVIGYEPIWAIGPGKTPPGAEYIGYVSSYIKSAVKRLFDFDPVVVYGGGLKEENAGMLSKIETIGGGLVALTKFTGDIAFEVEGLKRIIEKYLE